MKKPFEIKREEGMTVDPYARLVSLPVHSDNIFHFPEGLPAFENIKEFVFIHKPDTTPFLFMHAMEPADLAFVCVDPFLICPDYSVRISQSDLDFLHLEKPEDALTLSIVTVNHDMRYTTANLQGPIIINFQASLGKQIICEGAEYPVRYRIWQGLERIQKDNKAEETEKKEKVESK